MKINQASFYFIGIGGIGMSALAELLQRMGAKVSGSDMKESAQTEHLRKIGVEIFNHHSAENIQNVDVVVYSSAIQKQNPEVQEARRRKIPIIPRAEALAEIMRYKRGIAIAGTHGKTTTTSMLASIFMHSNLDPTIAVGGRLKLIESTARLGNGEWIVAEADESDGSFSRLSPEISVITNIDSDHLDYFGTFENVQSAFYNFAMKVPFYGISIVNGDDPQTKRLFAEFPKKIIFFGFSEGNDYQLKKEGLVYKVYHKDSDYGEFSLQVPGDHNALNALAACIAANQAGAQWEDCLSGVTSYDGVDRRFQFIGEKGTTRIYDDYAHHPTEIRATLQGAREKYPDKKIHVIYQPHRFSRTRDCWSDYLESFHDANTLYLLDIYPAGEEPIPGIESEKLAALMPMNCIYCSSSEKLQQKVLSHVKPGDVLFTMGAGNVYQYGKMLLELLPE